jgi:hypothetical protein
MTATPSDTAPHPASGSSQITAETLRQEVEEIATQAGFGHLIDVSVARCSSSGYVCKAGNGRYRITLNPRMLQAPAEARRFLAAHEIGHILGRRVGASWAELSQLIPAFVVLVVSQATAAVIGLGSQAHEAPR